LLQTWDVVFTVGLLERGEVVFNVGFFLLLALFLHLGDHVFADLDISPL